MLFSDNDEIDRFISTFYHDRPTHDMPIELNFDKNESILYTESQILVYEIRMTWKAIRIRRSLNSM